MLDSGSLEANGLAMTDERLCLTGAREWSTFASSNYKDAKVPAEGRTKGYMPSYLATPETIDN